MQVTMRSIRVQALISIGVLGLALTPGVRAESADTVKAVWQVQEIYFSYFGITTNYTCDGLRDKMRGFLRQLAVRDDMIVNASGCPSLNRPEKNLSVRIIAAHAVEATDENRKAIAADPKRAKLAERLQRKAKAAVAGDEPFDGVRRKVTLMSKDSPSVGGSGDCELLDQVRRQLLPKLGVKVIDNQLSCTPYQGTIGSQKLEVEVLAAAPVKS
jgi:hypothetical protein